jgi:hypothetical protein
MFVIPPGRKEPPPKPRGAPQWEILGCATPQCAQHPEPPLTMPLDLQRTAPRMTYAACQFLVPPDRSYTARDEARPRSGATQWEVPAAGTVLFQKDLGTARARGAHSSLEFLVATSPVQSSRRNVEVPSEHVALRAYVEAPRGLLPSAGAAAAAAAGAGAAAAALQAPALPAPGTARAPPPEAPLPGASAPGALHATMAEVLMLRDGRGPGARAALPRGMADAVAAARIVQASGAALSEGERRARIAQMGAVLAPGAQRAAVAAALGAVQRADAVLAANRLKAVDTRKYDSALRAAREGSLMASTGGTPAGLRRSLTARREALGV